MVNNIRNWCECLVVAVVISILIEMLLPDGNNKKYVKVVIGIYIIFVIINPIYEILNYNIDFKNILNFNNIEKSGDIKTSSNIDDYSNNIRKLYITGIESSIKEEIANLGYVADRVKVVTNYEYSEIEKIENKKVRKNIQTNNSTSINRIEPVVIENDNKQIHQYEDIKKYLAEKYFVKMENIVFN